VLQSGFIAVGELKHAEGSFAGRSGSSGGIAMRSGARLNLAYFFRQEQ
jgi:hypothetical protein